MYAKKHFNRDIELVSIPPQPTVNSVIQYRRCSNLSFHVVQEDDIVWQKKAAVCPRCNGVGHLAIHNGDDDIPCPVCGESDEAVF